MQRNVIIMSAYLLTKEKVMSNRRYNPLVRSTLVIKLGEGDVRYFIVNIKGKVTELNIEMKVENCILILPLK